MANFKRHKTRRNVRCTLCTTWRWLGNHKGRFKERETFEKHRFESGLDDDLLLTKRNSQVQS